MRHALRQLLRIPSFTAIAVLTLALGIGGLTTIFAIVDELTFKPVRGTSVDGIFHAGALQIPDYETLEGTPIEGVAAIAAFEIGVGDVLQIPGRAERVTSWRVSGGYAAVHDVRPQVGRWISQEDNVGGSRPFPLGQPGADVIVISDRIWREWFKADAQIAARGVVKVGGRPTQIVGVAPAGFETAIDIWMPFGRRRLLTREELDRATVTRGPIGRQKAIRAEQPRIQTVLRKHPEATVSDVNARLSAAVAARPSTLELPVRPINIRPRTGDDRLLRTGYVILGFAALIFIAACANLGNMIYARATEREGELAIRLSLGATRFGVLRLLLAETVLICGAASAAGLLFAIGALRLFTSAVPGLQIDYVRRVDLSFSLDWRIAACAGVAGAVAVLLIGAGSLWRSSRVSLLTRLAASGPAMAGKTEGRTLRTMLVSVQIVAAVLLLIATGMLLENTSKRMAVRLLFDSDNVVGARLERPPEYDAARYGQLLFQVVDRIRKIEGVEAAAIADALPGGEAPTPHGGVSSITGELPSGGLSGSPRRLDGQWIHASAGFVDTLGLRVLDGRDFHDGDETSADPVALISNSAAQGLWPGENPIGKRITCCGKAYLRRIVGVIPDPVRPAGALVILPASEHLPRSMLIVLRTITPAAAVQPLRDTVAALDPAVAVFGAGPVDVTQLAQTNAERSVRLLAGGLATVALGISIFGVYAVVSYFVSRRSREFGLRLALGSTRGQITKLVVDHAIHMVLIGLLPGVLFASWGTRVLQVELIRLRPNGITAWVVVPLLLLASGVVAAYIPARRAARIEPNKALKET